MEEIMNIVNKIQKLKNIDILLIVFFCQIEIDRRRKENKEVL